MKPTGVLCGLLCLSWLWSIPVRAGDWVIGLDDPDEAVVLDADRHVDGNLVLHNRGALTILPGRRLSLAGSVTLGGDSRLQIDGGALQFLQSFAYQSEIIAYERARLVFTDAVLDGSGFSYSVGLTGEAQAWYARVRVENGFSTWAAFGEAEIHLQDCDNAGEFVPFGDVTVDVAGSDVVLLWITLFDGSSIDTVLPPPGDVPAFDLDAQTGWDQGIPYSVRFRDCTGVWWALMARSGSTATVRNSALRAVGTYFEKDHVIAISGLANNTHLGQADFQWGDVAYHFTDTAVTSWNFYCNGQTRLTLTSCLFGELIAGDAGEAWAVQSLCDGSGGYLGAFGDSRLVMFLSTNLSQTTAGDSAAVYVVHSALLSPVVDAHDDALLLLVNALCQGDLRPRDGAAVFEGRLEEVRAEVGQRVTLRGSARVLPGPDSPLRLERYALQYGAGEDPLEWFPADDDHAAAVRDGILGTWDTAGLAPGRYTLRMWIYSQFEEPFEVTSAARLLESRELGDLTGDGRIRALDGIVLAHTLAGNIGVGEPPCRCPDCGDLDSDGLLGSSDQLMLTQLLAEN